MRIEIIIGIFIFLIFILYVFKKYNTLIKAKNKVKQAKSNIDIFLNQRFDLIPNLVECVKAYMQHEKDTLESITQMRNIYMQGNKQLKEAEKINNSMNKIVALAENYPELKASEQFLNLQRNLSKMESQLQAARRIYNNEVTHYNTKINVVPTNIIANLFGFQEEDLFQIEEYKKENIKIDLEG